MDFQECNEYEPFNSQSQTDQKQIYAGSRYQMDIEQGTNISSTPYMQIEAGNASTADLISQGSPIAVKHFFRPNTLETQRHNRRCKMARTDSRKRNKDSVSSDYSETGPGRQFISRCSFYCIAGLAFLAVIFAAVSFTMLFNLISKYEELERKLNSAQASYALAQKDAHTCLPCGELYQGPFEEDNEELKKLITKEENGVQICCTKTAAQLSIMLNLFAKRKQRENCAQESLEKENSTASACENTSAPITPPMRPNGTISAHLVVGGRHPQTDVDFQPIRHWRQGMPGTHMSNINVTAENSRIVVPETGLYFLYSQVGFLIYYDEDQAQPISSQSIFHVVYRYNAIYPLDGSEELLRSVITQCWEKNKDYGRYTSYVGAAVKLNKGDQLYVKVSRIQDVNKGASTTYFGLFKIN